MRLDGKRVGFAFTGSHCTLNEVLGEMERLTQEGAEIIPIFSASVASEDTRFGKAQDWRAKVEKIAGHSPLDTIREAEPIGPKGLLDVLVIAPCTGNTLAKLANGITDGPVLMAAKAHLRNNRPVVLAISTNDGLGMNAKNVGILLNAKNVYMVPFGQDAPLAKQNSLVAKMGLILDTVLGALEGKQIQPVLISRQ